MKGRSIGAENDLGGAVGGDLLGDRQTLRVDHAIARLGGPAFEQAFMRHLLHGVLETPPRDIDPLCAFGHRSGTEVAAHISAGFGGAVAPVQMTEPLGGQNQRIHPRRVLDQPNGQVLAQLRHQGPKAAAQNGGDVAARSGKKSDAIDRLRNMVQSPEARRALEQEMPEMIAPHSGKEPVTGQMGRGRIRRRRVRRKAGVGIERARRLKGCAIWPKHPTGHAGFGLWRHQDRIRYRIKPRVWQGTGVSPHPTIPS